MVIAYHKKLNQNGGCISNSSEVLEEKLYDVMRRKKAKLVNELKTEKLINPAVCLKADEAIEDIRNCKIGKKKVGNVSYYYTFLKGFYFYIHKIINRDDCYVNSIHMYFASHADQSLMDLIMEKDPLQKN